MSLFTSGYTGVEIDEGIRRTYEVFSNRNLIPNWYMPTPVNQRGIVSGATISTPAYFLDGLKLISGSCIWTVGQRLSVANASVVMFNMEKYYGRMLDETYTFSIDTSDGIKSVTFKFPSAVSGATVYTETGITGYCTIKAGFEYRAGGEIICGATLYYVPYIEITATDDIELIPWLEQNSVSTMANATQPDFGEQLALCQRYYLVVGASERGYGNTNPSTDTTCHCFYATPVTMRINPSFSAAAGDFRVNGDGKRLTPSAISGIGVRSGGIAFTLTIPTSIGTAQAISIEMPASMVVSADL